MKKIILAAALLSACTTKQQDLSKQASKEVTEADIAMNNLAAQTGFHKALLEYADDSVIKPTDGRLPVIGKSNLITEWANETDTKEITWQPFRSEASVSGDMGYTFGNWQYKGKDTTMHGNYYTIWKRQKDGKWKFVVDGGNNTPAQGN